MVNESTGIVVESSRTPEWHRDWPAFTAGCASRWPGKPVATLVVEGTKSR